MLVGLIVLPLVMFMALFSSNVVDNNRCTAGIAKTELDKMVSNAGSTSGPTVTAASGSC